jgi:hypothetical protein
MRALYPDGHRQGWPSQILERLLIGVQLRLLQLAADIGFAGAQHQILDVVLQKISV